MLILTLVRAFYAWNFTSMMLRNQVNLVEKTCQTFRKETRNDSHLFQQRPNKVFLCVCVFFKKDLSSEMIILDLQRWKWA